MYAPCESHQGRIPQNRTVCFLFPHLKIRIFNQSTAVELFGKPFQIKNTVFVIEALPSPVQSDILCETYLSDVIPIATSRFNAHQAYILYHIHVLFAIFFITNFSYFFQCFLCILHQNFTVLKQKRGIRSHFSNTS